MPRVVATIARLLVAGALVLPGAVVPAPAQAPAAGASPAASRRTPFTLDVGGWYQALDNGYDDWKGLDLRLSYTGERVTPFLGISTQRRGTAAQENFGLGSYVTIDRHTYAIVGFSTAPGGNAILHPRIRWDAALLTDSRVVPGLVLSLGYTHLMFSGHATGQIGSLGAILYRGPFIVSGAARLNHDDVGGASTGSGEIGAQHGAQGRQWIGGRLSFGHEAYQIISERPFDVQFTTIGGSAFWQRWLTTRTAATLRLDYENKRTAYHRTGAALTYSVAF